MASKAQLEKLRASVRSARRREREASERLISATVGSVAGAVGAYGGQRLLSGVTLLGWPVTYWAGGAAVALELTGLLEGSLVVDGVVDLAKGAALGELGVAGALHAGAVPDGE